MNKCKVTELPVCRPAAPSVRLEVEEKDRDDERESWLVIRGQMVGSLW